MFCWLESLMGYFSSCRGLGLTRPIGRSSINDLGALAKRKVRPDVATTVSDPKPTPRASGKSGPFAFADLRALV